MAAQLHSQKQKRSQTCTLAAAWEAQHDMSCSLRDTQEGSAAIGMHTWAGASACSSSATYMRLSCLRCLRTLRTLRCRGIDVSWRLKVALRLLRRGGGLRTAAPLALLAACAPLRKPLPAGCRRGRRCSSAVWCPNAAVALTSWPLPRPRAACLPLPRVPSALPPCAVAAASSIALDSSAAEFE